MIVSLFGGPAHGKRYEVPTAEVGFLTCAPLVGHYARVSGGRNDEWYWYEIEPPMAISAYPGGPLILVRKRTPHEESSSK